MLGTILAQSDSTRPEELVLDGIHSRPIGARNVDTKLKLFSIVVVVTTDGVEMCGPTCNLTWRDEQQIPKS